MIRLGFTQPLVTTDTRNPGFWGTLSSTHMDVICELSNRGNLARRSSTGSSPSRPTRRSTQSSGTTQWKDWDCRHSLDLQKLFIVRRNTLKQVINIRNKNWFLQIICHKAWGGMAPCGTGTWPGWVCRHWIGGSTAWTVVRSFAGPLAWSQVPWVGIEVFWFLGPS